MFAVIKTGGKQYLVEQGTKLKIEKIPGAVGDAVVFDQVLLTGEADGSALSVGKPLVTGVTVTGTITAQEKAPKIRIVKFKRKVRYKRTRGHRQEFTGVHITAIK